MKETEKLLKKKKKTNYTSSTDKAEIANSSNAADIIDMSNGEHTDTPTLYRLIYLGIIVILPGVGPGMSFGFPAVALPQMSYLTIDEVSWFASLSAITMPIGCLLSGPIIDKYGRKSALMIANVPSICGWLLMATNSKLIDLYISRLLLGLAVGLSTTPAAVYSAECITIHNPTLRGSLSTWSTIALTSGVLLSYLAGGFFWYTTVAYIGAMVSLVSLILVAIIIPESPTWLHGQGRVAEAEEAERILKITQPVLKQTIIKQSKEEIKPNITWNDILYTLSEMQKPEAYRPLFIMISFLFFQQFAGLYVVITYMVTILESTGAYFIHPGTGAIINGVIILGAAVSVSFILPRLGVRRLSLISCSGVALSMLTVAVYMSLRPVYGPETYYLSIIPFLAIMSSVLMSGLGFIPIPYSMLGEVFPTDVKGMASGIAGSLSSTFCFIAIKSYPYLFEMLGPGVFYIYSFLAFSCCLFVMKYLPETTGMTLSQIGDSFGIDGYTPYTLIE
uniref:Facilitated trehalose transporter Tret1 n=1 Tax=Cacopsylla melanoneura TaxID=428564 RepID=A0A8D9EJL9_9HEMI